MRQFYDIYKRKFNLRIQSLFDSITFKKFVPRGTPHLIWVNDKGRIVAITTTGELTDLNVSRFLKNEEFDFIDISYKANTSLQTVDRQRPLLIGGNGGNDTSYLFRSVLSDWNDTKAKPFSMDLIPIKQASGRNMYQAIGASIDVLFSIAFWGKLDVEERLPSDVYQYPIITEEAAKSLKERFGGTKRFNYCMEVPGYINDINSLMQIMQKDLCAYFNLDAKIVKRKIPCYELVVTDEGKFNALVSKGGKIEVSWKDEDEIHSFKNIPDTEILPWLRSRIISGDKVVYRNTILRNASLSFELEAQVSDRESIKRGLQKLGMDLNLTKKLMNVLVITEGQL